MGKRTPEPFVILDGNAYRVTYHAGRRHLQSAPVRKNGTVDHDQWGFVEDFSHPKTKLAAKILATEVT